MCSRMTIRYTRAHMNVYVKKVTILDISREILVFLWQIPYYYQNVVLES